MSGLSADPAAWAALGGLLQDRRGELDPRYVNRRVFADAQGVNYRVIWDIEHGRRSNFGRSMLTAIEVAYGLARGSIAAYLAGGELEALPGTPPASPGAYRGNVTELLPAVVRDYWDDQVIGSYVRKLWALDVSEAQRLTLIEDLAAIRDKYRSNGPGSGTAAAR